MIVSDSRSSPGLIPVVTLGRYLGISFSTGVLPVFHSAFRCFTLDNRSLFRLSLHLLPTLVIFQVDIIARGSQRKRQICQTVCNNCFSSTKSNSKTFRTLYRSWTLTFFNAFMFQKDLLPPHDLIACLRRSLPPAGSSLTNCYPRGLFAPLRHPSRHLF